MSDDKDDLLFTQRANRLCDSRLPGLALLRSRRAGAAHEVQHGSRCHRFQIADPLLFVDADERAQHLAMTWRRQLDLDERLSSRQIPAAVLLKQRPALRLRLTGK